MLRKRWIASLCVIAALSITASAGAQISIASPFNPGGLPVPNPHPRPAVLGNMGFTTPIFPVNDVGFFSATTPVFFDENGAVINPALPPVGTEFPAQPPLTGNSFVPLTPTTGGMPIGAAGVGNFGAVTPGPTGFVPVTSQALPNQAPLVAPTSSLGLAHRAPIQTTTGVGTAIGNGGFVAVTPDVLAIQPTNAIPRTSDSVDARMLTDGRLRVHWNGVNQLVDHAVISLLDKNRAVIKSVEITRPPLEAIFKLTNKSAFYQVVIYYVNGTVTSIVSPV